MLQRLLQQTLPDPGKASILANEMTDWIDSNNIVDAVERRGRRGIPPQPHAQHAGGP
jgi:type II secretory pathway component PulK